MSNKLLALLSIAICFSCVDPITLENEGESNLLVVEGGITTELGPHIIKLTRSAKYGTIFQGVIQNVTGADVFVRDNLGFIIKLNEKGQGVYTTPNDFQGVVGRDYIIIIETSDGKEYTSYPDQLVEAPKIESLYFEFSEVPIVTEENEEGTVSGVDVHVVANDSPDSRNYYQWKTSGVYRIKTNPELFTPPRSRNPVPKDCCEICYITEDNKGIYVESDKLFNGNSFNKPIAFIKDDGARFGEKYILEVEQHSLSKEAYEFYDLLHNQLQIKGEIFDPPPAEIRGNIICISNPEEKVVGYFTASDVKKEMIEIFGDELPYKQSPPVIPDDCRLLNDSSTEPPSYW